MNQQTQSQERSDVAGPLQEAKDGANESAVRPTADSHFAWIRTRLAADSALMGWMGLATTLIGFGFAIVQFFDRLEGMSNIKPALAPYAPHYLGLALIFSGAFCLLAAIRQHISFVNYLRSEEFLPVAAKAMTPVNKPAVAVALALAMIGAAAFVAILFRLS
jgi:putative membrane protein